MVPVPTTWIVRFVAIHGFLRTSDVLMLCLPSLSSGRGGCGLPSSDRHRSPPGLLGHADADTGTPRHTNVVQLPLDYPERRIHGSIRRDATLGDVEALSGEQE